MEVGRTVKKVMFSAAKMFGYDITGARLPNQYTTSTVPRSIVGKRITVKLVDFLQQLSDFGSMTDEQILENMYIWDPEIGGAIDRQSTLISQCYKGPIINDTDKDDSKIEQDMLKDAIKVADTMQIANKFEMYGELISMYGDVYIDVRDPMVNRIIPNRYVTLIENMDQLGIPNRTILLTEENFLVFNEMFSSNQFVLNKNEFVHLKYKDTPIFAEDLRGRLTYGMYSISPVQRAILSTWQKRLVSIIDILYRWKILPREVHKINSAIFGLDIGTGNQLERIDTVKAEAANYINEYVDSMQNQTPDQGYTVLDTINIEMLETKSNTYMRTNELLDQLDAKSWVAVNMPKSVVTGDNAGSYASELVISNYVSQKALLLATKIKPVLLSNLRARLTAINSSYPVNKLDIKLELSMATTELEMFRQASIMGALNATMDIFTSDEIRAKVGYAPLTKQQKEQIKQERVEGTQLMGSKSLGDIQRDAISMNPGGQHPSTAQSDNKHNDNTGKKEVPNK